MALSSRKRFWRLAPLFFFCSLFSIAFSGFARPDRLEFYTYGLALLSGLFTLNPGFFFPPQNTVLWSLGVEFLFSLALPALVWAMRRNLSACVVAILVASFSTRWYGKQVI